MLCTTSIQAELNDLYKSPYMLTYLLAIYSCGTLNVNIVFILDKSNLECQFVVQDNPK